MSADLALGIMALVALSTTGALVLRLLIRSPDWINWLADAAFPALRRRLRPRIEQPLGRPIEDIARHVRRLGAEFHASHPGQSWVKSEAIRRAYDDALTEGCHALQIPTDLTDLDPGTEQDAERLRVEYLLTDAGLILRPAA